MKKIKRAAMWAANNAAFGYLLWLATFRKVEGAENVVVFWTWFLTIVSFAYLTDGVLSKMAEIGPTVPAAIDVAFDLAVICTMVWYGWSITGMAYMLHFVLLRCAWSLAEKKK